MLNFAVGGLVELAKFNAPITATPKKRTSPKKTAMTRPKLHNCPELIDYVNEVGFLPLLNMGIGLSAEEAVDDDCHYVVLPDGGWEWPLWEWKGSVLRESGCAYGKFLRAKATFVSREWWPDFCNYRRSLQPAPDEESVEGLILQTLREEGSIVTRELRALCGFTGTRMRSKFDAYVTRLQMQCRVVTEDFVYPHDSHGHRYGWGWSLLTTPEHLFGAAGCQCPRTPEESRQRLMEHLRQIMPAASEKKLISLLG